MNGQQLFENYRKDRDYSGSPSDQYAQLLQTVFHHIGTDIFNLLEKAEAEGKRIDVKNPFEDSQIHWDEINPQDVIFV